MDLALLVKWTLTASISLLVIALGLKASVGAVTYLFRHPGSLLRALVAMNVIVPAIAVALVLTLDLKPAVRVALVAMAISPVPPLLPRKLFKLGAREEFVYGLLVAASLFAVITIPLTLSLLSRFGNLDVDMRPARIAGVVATTILAPLVLGMIVRRLAPTIAEAIYPWISRIGTVLLLLGFVPLLIVSVPRLLALVGDGTLLAIVIVVIGALAAGHLLGGRGTGDRTALAISSATRHPGMAIAIGAANYPEANAVPAAVLLFALIGAIVTALYAKWVSRGAAAPANAGPAART